MIIVAFALTWWYQCADEAVSTDVALIRLVSGEPSQNKACLPRNPGEDWQRLSRGIEIQNCYALGYGLTSK